MFIFIYIVNLEKLIKLITINKGNKFEIKSLTIVTDQLLPNLIEVFIVLHQRLLE